MSNQIQYDSLLVHYLALELHRSLSGDRLRGVAFHEDQRRLTLALTDHTLHWELHPTRGWIRRVQGTAAAGDAATRGWGGRDIAIQRRARVLGVSAPADERVIEIAMDAGGEDVTSRLVVELMTNQWNALALDPAGRIVRALWPRRAGGRILGRGQSYVTPWGATFRPAEGDGPRPIPDPTEGRAGVDEPLTRDRWEALLADVPPERRRGALLREVAWTSGLNARAILGGPDAGDDSLDATWERYRRLASRPAAEPRVLDGPQPYPLPLPGTPSRPMDSLLEALAPGSLQDAAGLETDAPPDPAASSAGARLAPEVRAALESRRNEAATRARRLAAQVEAAPERAAKLRRQADLLMSQLHRIERGAERAELDDFEGGSIVVQLDPSLAPHENAESWYDRAKRRERAAERLPSKVREAEAERDRLSALLTDAEAGAADPDELERWIREVRPAPTGDDGEEERLPYVEFRSSGGYEIRVGRGARSNDDLTFHHSSPDDVWLHARDVAGAHVILRWDRRDQNPPRRDLTEAAILAALHSRARTAGVVPVDWTRRKYVRKPRKAPPGAVLPDRVETVFVEPDRGAMERLRLR